MKKCIAHIPRLFVITAIAIAVGCNSAQTTDDNDRTAPDNGSSHPAGGDTSMTDTTRTVISTQGNNANAAMTDTGFISKNIVDNMMEIQLSKMGQNKATNAQLKKVAGQMITEHTQMLNELKALAGKKQVTVPTSRQMDMSSMPGLAGASGKEFDNMWQSEMLKMHEAKIAELESVMQQTTDADIKNLATKALPKIKHHREMLTVVKP